MQISIILAHPDRRSFNHAIAHAAAAALRRNGHTVRLHDLYRERFNPILYASEIPAGARLPPTIRRHRREIARADGIVIVHPNWRSFAVA